MKAGRQAPLVLMLAVAIAACDAATSAESASSEQTSPRATSALAPSPSVASATNPIAPPPPSSPAPSDTPPPTQLAPPGDPGPQPASLPVRGTAYDHDPLAETTPTSDGGLYVAVSVGWQEDDGTLTLTALDGSGAVRPGWPIALPGGTDYCQVAVADDDTVRVVCGTTALAYDLQARQLAGWPVDLGGWPSAVIVVGRELRAQVKERRWVSVGPDGSVTRRKGVMPTANGYNATIAEAVDRWGEPTSRKPWRVWLHSAKGVLPGWPVKVPGSASEPVVGPDGTVYLVALAKKGSMLIVIRRTGKRIASRTALINDVPPHDGSWYGPYIPQSPVVGPDGSVWVVGGSRAYAFDPKGRLRKGWPAKLGAPLADTGYCSSECDTDCYYLPADPFSDQDGTLYVLRAPSSKSTGGSVLAIGLDGKVVPGWPVQLKRAGSEFWYGTVGPDGTVFVDAYEPEPKVKWTDECFEPASLTTLAIRPDSTVRYRVTLVDP